MPWMILCPALSSVPPAICVYLSGQSFSGKGQAEMLPLSPLRQVFSAPHECRLRPPEWQPRLAGAIAGVGSFVEVLPATVAPGRRAFVVFLEKQRRQQ